MITGYSGSVTNINYIPYGSTDFINYRPPTPTSCQCTVCGAYILYYDIPSCACSKKAEKTRALEELRSFFEPSQNLRIR